MQSSNIVLKTKKKKLKDKLKSFKNEEKELLEVFGKYINNVQKNVEELLTTTDVTEFNEKYDSISSSLDNYSTELFNLKLNFSFKLETIFNIVCQTPSSDDESFKSLRSSSQDTHHHKEKESATNSNIVKSEVSELVTEDWYSDIFNSENEGSHDDGVVTPNTFKNRIDRLSKDCPENIELEHERVVHQTERLQSNKLSSPLYEPNHFDANNSETNVPHAKELPKNSEVGPLRSNLNPHASFDIQDSDECVVRQTDFNERLQSNRLSLPLYEPNRFDVNNSQIIVRHAKELPKNSEVAPLRSNLNPHASLFDVSQCSSFDIQDSDNLLKGSFNDIYHLQQKNIEASARDYVGNIFKIKVTHVNDLVNFYVLTKPEESQQTLQCLWNEINPLNLVNVTEPQDSLWYIVHFPTLPPVRVQLLGWTNETAKVRNLDVGNEFQVPMHNLYQISSPHFYLQPCAVQCSLYQYESVKGWNTSDVVEKFKEIICDKIVYGIFYANQQLNSEQFVEIFLDHNGSPSNLKDILATSSQNGMKLNHKDVLFEKLPSVNGENDIQVENSSGRSTPENIFEWKARIKDPYCPEIKDGSLDPISCLVSFIESPAKFYVNLALEESCAINLDELENDMQKLYCFKLKQPVYMKVAVQVKSFWCCKNPEKPEENRWYRVQVVSFLEDECMSSDTSLSQKSGVKKRKHRNMNPETSIQVKAVDYGTLFKVKLKDLYPLAKPFLELPALAVQCSLSNIVPPDEKDYWPETCIKCFMDFCGNYQSEMTLKILNINGPGNFDVKLHNSEGVSASYYLVHEKFANYRISNPELKSFENFDPMTDESKSHRNNFNYDVDDPCVAITGYKPKDETYLCKYFMNFGKCNKRNCPYQHTQTNGLYTIDKSEVMRYKNDHFPEIGVRLIVEVVTVYDPGHFFVHCPWGFEDALEIVNSPEGLRKKLPAALLEQEMNKYYNDNSSVLDNMALEVSMGGLVACVFEETGSWYRGEVIDGDKDDGIEVNFIDYGNVAIVQRASIRELKPQFAHQPRLAVDCHLHNICPVENKNQYIWTKESKEFFKSQTEGLLLIAKVQKISGTSITINLYQLSDNVKCINRELVNRGFAKWFKHEITNSSDDFNYEDLTDETNAIGYKNPG